MRTRRLTHRAASPTATDTLDMEFADSDSALDDLEDVGLASQAMDQLTAPSQPGDSEAARQRQLAEFRAVQQVHSIGLRDGASSKSGPEVTR